MAGAAPKPSVLVGNFDISGIACIVALVFVCLAQMAWSVLTCAFRRTREKPELVFLDTDSNRERMTHLGILTSYSPPFWCLERWSQTIIGGCRAPKHATPYRRELLRLKDGVQVALDYKEKPDLPMNAPIILVLHGLGGHSRTNSCNFMTESLVQAGSWRVVVYNRRGHGGVSLLPAPSSSVAGSVSSTAASHTWRDTPASSTVPSEPDTPLKPFPQHVELDDMQEVVAHIVATYPNAPKALLGLSAGANLAVFYQGRCAKESPFQAAISVSNGHELKHLTTALFKEPMADWLLVTFLKEVLYERWHEITDLVARTGVAMDWPALLRLRHTQHFEGMLTAPAYGYKNVEAYYEANSCAKFFKDVEAPLLSLANADDPIIDECLIKHVQDAARENPAIISVATRRGGHLGWLHGPWGQPWMHLVVTAYLKTVFEPTPLQ